MDTALLQDSQEQTIHQNYESDTVERLFRVVERCLSNRYKSTSSYKLTRPDYLQLLSPGMFSLSLKCKTATVALREGYKLTWKISKSTSSLSSKR
ncbi:hypothetical protein Peur_033457 [Populus x canadensis]